MCKITRKVILNLVLISCCCCFFIAEAGKKVLRILNWSEFILAVDDMMEPNVPMRWRSPILAAFMAKYNCKVEYYEYDDVAELLHKIESMPEFYDVVITANAQVSSLVATKKLSKLNYDLLPNSRHITERFHSIEEDEKGQFFVPYLVGTTGMIYNSEAFNHKVDSWKEIFAPVDKAKGKVNIFNDSHVMLPIVLQYLGNDPNTHDVAKIKIGGQLLRNLYRAGSIGMFSSDISVIRDGLISGKIIASPLYSGDALSLIKRYEGLGFKYIIPKEGGEFYIDCVTIPAFSKNKKLAHKFVNYLLDPAVHAENAMYLNYLCPNKTSEKIIKEKAGWQLDNPIIYPDEKTLNRVKIYSNNHPEIKRWWKKIFK